MRVIGRVFSGYVLVSPAFLFMSAGIAVPVIFMVLISFWTQTSFDLVPNFTFENYLALTERGIYIRLFLKTILVAGTVAAVTVILAFPVAYFLAFHVNRNKMVWIVLVTLPFWISYLLRIFSWKIILGYNGIVNSGLIWLGVIEQPLGFLLHNLNAVVIALSHSWAAFAILPIYVSLEKIDRSLIEAAADLGESTVMRFFRIIVPLSTPGIMAASLLVFIPVAADFVTPKLVGGIDGVMIGSMIQTYFGPANDWPFGAAISIAAILGFSAVIALYVLTLYAMRRILS